MKSKIPKKIFVNFEEMWLNLNEKQKKANIEYWHELYAVDKILKPLKINIIEITKEKEYWKNRFKDLQNKLIDPLDEIFVSRFALPQQDKQGDRNG